MSSQHMFDDVNDANELIGQAVGAGSMCWENVRAAGEFDSLRASAIADAAFYRLQMILAERFSSPESSVGQVLTKPQEGE
jgi:hypothetical protein